jgi:hypothetical protein
MMDIKEMAERIRTEKGKYRKALPRIIPEIKEKVMYIK